MRLAWILACASTASSIACSGKSSPDGAAPTAASGASSTVSQPAEAAHDPGRPRRTLGEHVERVLQATLKEDHAAMVDLMHPKLVDRMGGREKALEMVTGVSGELKRGGFAITDVSLKGEAEIVEEKGIFYAVVPYDFGMTGPGGKKGAFEAFLIGVSLDGADSWRFVDGGAVEGDRDKLKQVIKRFPDQLALPALRPPTWGD